MKTVPFGIAGVAAATGLFIFSSSLRAQEDGPPPPTPSRALSASVDFGNDVVFQPAKHGTNFDPLGLLPQQTLTITVTFPTAMAGQAILAEPLDGGSLPLPEGGLVVGADGTVVFQFQASGSPGACRIEVHQPDDSNFVKLWVVDPEHRENTPPDLPGVY